MNLPASFIDYTRALLGNEEYEKLAVALQQEPPVSIRLNEKLGALSQNAGAAHSSFFIHHSSFFISTQFSSLRRLTSKILYKQRKKSISQYPHIRRRNPEPIFRPSSFLSRNRKR